MSSITAGTTSTTTLVHSGDTTGSLVFKTNDTGSGGTTAVTIDTSQNVLVGTTTTTNNTRLNQKLAVVTTGSGVYGGISNTSYNGTSAGVGPIVDFQRSRGTTDGSMTAVASGDTLGYMVFRGSDGTSFQDSSYITGQVDGSVSAGTVPGRLVFNTSNAERMRIDSSGMLGIGTTSSASSRLSISGTATLCMMKNESATSGTAQTTILFRDNGDNTRGSITVSTSGTVYNTTSDYRLKENIAPMTGALAKVDALKPCTYTWKETGDSGQGFIAHELAEVVPECVTGEKDAVETRDGKEFIVPQGIDTSFLVATLTAALQETKALIDQQAETINALTARVVALESK